MAMTPTIKHLTPTVVAVVGLAYLNSIQSRSYFALQIANKYFDKMKHDQLTGNLFTGHAGRKFAQARRVYIHYSQVFQRLKSLPLCH